MQVVLIIGCPVVDTILILKEVLECEDTFGDFLCIINPFVGMCVGRE